MADLKPCPFCGGKAIAYKEPNYVVNITRYKVICEVCSAQMYRGTMSEVIEAWNARADGWISVKERLPEQRPLDDRPEVLASDYVLVLIRYDDDFYWIRTSAYVGKAWLADIPGEGRQVTHWMPGPEPPKEG